MHESLASERIRLNYQDYCALPEDGRRYEILDGDLFMSPSPQTAHQRLLVSLGTILVLHVRERSLGEVFFAPFDVLLGEHDIVQPDIIFVASANRSIVTDKHIRGVPDLLIEIVSPTRIEYDTRDKRAVYARCGVPWYWIVDPQARKLVELKLAGDAYAVAADPGAEAMFRPRLFPELELSLAGLWP